MAEQLILKNLPFIKILPTWAQEMSYKYCSKTANLYLVHGNIRDFLPHKMNEGEFIFVRIQEYVSEVLFGNRDIIVFYDRSSGVSFCTLEMARDYTRTRKKAFSTWKSISWSIFPNSGVSSLSWTTPKPSCPPAISPVYPKKTATPW